MTEKKEKPIEMVVVDSVDECPSNYYIVNALGQCVFFKTKDRIKAQKKCDEEYGKGHYKIRVTGLSNSRKDNLTCR